MGAHKGELHEICTCPVRYIFRDKLTIVSEIELRQRYFQLIIRYKMGLILLRYQPSIPRSPNQGYSLK